jgi:hypothetical protein
VFSGKIVRQSAHVSRVPNNYIYHVVRSLIPPPHRPNHRRASPHDLHPHRCDISICLWYARICPHVPLSSPQDQPSGTLLALLLDATPTENLVDNMAASIDMMLLLPMLPRRCPTLQSPLCRLFRLSCSLQRAASRRKMPQSAHAHDQAEDRCVLDAAPGRIGTEGRRC